MDKTEKRTPKREIVYVESESGICLTRRNIFDIFIAILLAVIIIYIVVQWRKASLMKMESIVPASIASAFTAPAAPQPAMTAPAKTNMGDDMFGGSKGILKNMYKRWKTLFK